VTLNWPFENRDGILFIEDSSSIKLTEQYKTPLYVYSESKLHYNIDKLQNCLEKNYPKTRILYACKANTNVSILRVLHSKDVEIDAVSPGEVFLAIKAGFKPANILFTGTSVSEDELRFLVDEGIRMNFDSISQLEKLLLYTTPEIISLRINPEVGAGHHDHVITAGPDVKFGVWEGQALEGYKIAKRAGVSRFGIQMHIGSGIMDVNNFIVAVKRLLEITKNISESIGISFEFIDIGGGIGVPYHPEESEINIDAFIGNLFEFIKKKLEDFNLGEPEIWVEPGRYLVAESGILLTKVTTLKNSLNKVFVGVDAGFNTLVRPTMYGSYHHILNASGLNNSVKRYNVYGPLCESGDVFARDRTIPEVKENDILAIMNAGAYGFSMSSNYNSRPKPAEVLVFAGESRLIRKRESLDDLFRGQF
jgi:diaminopimelate decarboxylase